MITRAPHPTGSLATFSSFSWLRLSLRGTKSPRAASSGRGEQRSPPTPIFRSAAQPTELERFIAVRVDAPPPFLALCSRSLLVVSSVKCTRRGGELFPRLVVFVVILLARDTCDELLLCLRAD